MRTFFSWEAWQFEGVEMPAPPLPQNGFRDGPERLPGGPLHQTAARPSLPPWGRGERQGENLGNGLVGSTFLVQGWPRVLIGREWKIARSFFRRDRDM